MGSSCKTKRRSNKF